jgi:single-strand DNA-binding protein
MNRLTLIGYLGNDAEKKDGNNGAFTVFSVATKTSWKNKTTGEWESRTEWHRCVAGGERLAAFAATLKKGAHVHVEGELRSREYEKNGVTQRVFECRVSSILKLDRVVREDDPAEEAGA